MNLDKESIKIHSTRIYHVPLKSLILRDGRSISFAPAFAAAHSQTHSCDQVKGLLFLTIRLKGNCFLPLEGMFPHYLHVTQMIIKKFKNSEKMY